MPHHEQPIASAEELFQRLLEVMGYPERRPVLIGIDGRAGAGKSGLAAWLSWQMGLPFVSLDLFMVQNSEPLEWRYQDLSRVMCGRLALGKPLIVEGLCLRQALQAIDHDPDFLIWVENEGGPEHGPEEPTQEYEREFDPVRNADYRLTWCEPQQQPQAEQKPGPVMLGEMGQPGVGIRHRPLGAGRR